MSSKKPLPNPSHKGGERGAQDSFYEPYKYYDPFVEGSFR